MGNWSENQNKLKEQKEEERLKREKLAGYFLDLSKLTFAAVVLGSFSPLFSENMGKSKLPEMIVGAITTIVLAILGYIIIKRRKI